ncbi:MAG: hypothetical protein R2877_04990 [Bdellovibrionota bacterium]
MNAEMHQPIEFVESNLLSGVSGPFDVIVANLPYVPSGDIPGLSSEVRSEPILALDSGRDGLDHYRRLIPELKNQALRQRYGFFEYGIHQTSEMISLLKAQGFTTIEVRKRLCRHRSYCFCTEVIMALDKIKNSWQYPISSRRNSNQRV